MISGSLIWLDGFVWFLGTTRGTIYARAFSRWNSRELCNMDNFGILVTSHDFDRFKFWQQ